MLKAIVIPSRTETLIMPIGMCVCVCFRALLICTMLFYENFVADVHFVKKLLPFLPRGNNKQHFFEYTIVEFQRCMHFYRIGVSSARNGNRTFMNMCHKNYIPGTPNTYIIYCRNSYEKLFDTFFLEDVFI